VAITTYLDAPSPLSLRRHLYRHTAATIVVPMPVSLRLSRASGWLLHRHLSRRDILADRRRITTFSGEIKLKRIDMCDITPGNM